jgi:hypothetical protein
MYMLGVASMCQLVAIDNTLSPTSWIRLTEAGYCWLENPITLDAMEVTRPQVMEE